MKEACKKGMDCEPEVFESRDTLRQLLARSRYLLFKQKARRLEQKSYLNSLRISNRYTTIHSNWERYSLLLMTRTWQELNWRYGTIR